MRICIIQNVLDPFKGGNHLPLFASLPEVSFTIVCNRYSATSHELPPNLSVVTVPGRIGPYYFGCADFLFARHVLATYPASSNFWEKFDCIHLNQTMGPAFRKLKATGKPLLFLIHHPVTADHDIAIAESSGMERVLWKMRYVPLIRFQKLMCTAADRVITVSQTMKHRIISDYRIASDRVAVVPNGIAVNRFAAVSDAQCTHDVIAVGSFVHPRKGFRYLLDAYRMLASAGYNIADVGRRSEDQKQELQSIDGVTVYGTVGEDQIVDLLEHARVLLSTSLFEGFGLSLIESLACGHPSFAFGCGAVPEVLEPVDSDLIIPPRDTTELCRRIKAYLVLAPAERDRKGALYRAIVHERYSLEKSAKALDSVYRNASLSTSFLS